MCERTAGFTGWLSHIKDPTRTQLAGFIGDPAYTSIGQVFDTDLGAKMALDVVEGRNLGLASL